MTTKVTVRTVADLEKSALNTLRAGLIRRGVAPDVATREIATGTQNQTQFRAYAEMMGQVYANERAVEDAQMPDSAIGEDLDRLCAQRGLARLPGSGAAGDVVVTCSGVATYGAGQELLSKKGKRYRVVLSTTAGNGDPVGIIGLDVGKATNLAAGEVLTWVSPPGSSAATCVVGIAGLTNGQEQDTDARLRERLLKNLQNPPGAGNWSQLRQWAEEASAGVEAAYVYPAVHGPGTVHVAVTVAGAPDNNYSRAAPSALVDEVRNRVLADYPQPADVYVSGCAHQVASVAIKLSLPDPATSGGPGGGWVDATPWPPGPCAVTAVVTASRFTVNTLVTPVVGASIAFWDPSAMIFRHCKVIAYSGSSSSYTITVDDAFPAVGIDALVSPDAEQIDVYGRVMCEQFARLGPGHRTFNTGRSQRHPYVSSDDPAKINGTLLSPLPSAQPEIVSASFLWVNGSSTTNPDLIPTAVTAHDTAPNIWRLTHVGFYKT